MGEVVEFNDDDRRLVRVRAEHCCRQHSKTQRSFVFLVKATRTWINLWRHVVTLTGRSNSVRPWHSRWMASASGIRTVRLWDNRTGNYITTLDEHRTGLRPNP
jgi:hypothetical protein